MNNIKQLPRLMVFTIVAQKKSFTEAAKHLKLSKSAVSQQVSALEKELGVTLLNRTTREMSLTAIGSTLLKRCNVLQDQLSLAFSDLEEAGVNPKGRFAVTYPHSLEATIVLPAIEQLTREYPNLEPVLIADDKSLDLLESQLDAAIHIGELADSSYRALPVGGLSELFCASPAYLNNKGSISSIDELIQHPWISASWQTASMTVNDLKSGNKNIVDLNQYAKASTLPAVLGMTLRNLGIALIPDVVARPLFRSGDLVHIATHLTGPEWPVYTVHPYQKEKPMHLTRFHQMVYRRFESM